MTRSGTVLVLVLGVAAVACVKDVVQPDVGAEAVCGNGVVDPGEGCDVASPGCVDCQVAAGWACASDTCTPTCGDGVVGTGPSCANPHRDTDCDMTGYWAVSETDYTCDDLFHQPQTSSNWYLYHLTQTGDDFVVDQELDCGIHVTGSATIDYTAASFKALLYTNAMDGSAADAGAAADGGAGVARPPRHGTSAATAGGCAVTLDRWYKIAGVDESYLPPDFSAKPDLSSLTPLPSVSDPVNDPDDPPGAIDPDGDGFPGIGIQITGIVNGLRDSAQRNWKEYTTTGSPVPAAALQFDVPGAFDLQENILHVSQCGTGCALLDTGAAVSKAPGKITFAFVGRTLGSARVAPVVAGLPRQSVAADLTTCQNVQQALPHETTAPADACPSGSP
ncbi:MAG TPA: hypothetical protein VGG39_11535 [Polyangiaceae bacterium]|jgi:hypothetical protein